MPQLIRNLDSIFVEKKRASSIPPVEVSTGTPGIDAATLASALLAKVTADFSGRPSAPPPRSSSTPPAPVATEPPARASVAPVVVASSPVPASAVPPSAVPASAVPPSAVPPSAVPPSAVPSTAPSSASFAPPPEPDSGERPRFDLPPASSSGRDELEDELKPWHARMLSKIFR